VTAAPETTALDPMHGQAPGTGPAPAMGLVLVTKLVLVTAPAPAPATGLGMGPGPRPAPERLAGPRTERPTARVPRTAPDRGTALNLGTRGTGAGLDMRAGRHTGPDRVTVPVGSPITVRGRAPDMAPSGLAALVASLARGTGQRLVTDRGLVTG
jgi:hypothetical protein